MFAILDALNRPRGNISSLPHNILDEHHLAKFWMELAVSGSTALLRNEPVQARSNARLSSLLDAAAEAIDEVGYERLTTAMVADRAGASIGTVYRYFPDRIVVLQSVAARSFDRVCSRIDARLQSRESADWWEKIDAVIDELVSAFASEPAFAALRFGDVLDLRPREKQRGGYGALAASVASALENRHNVRGDVPLAFHLEVVLTFVDSLVARAFSTSRKGEKAYLDEARSLAHVYLKGFLE